MKKFLINFNYQIFIIHQKNVKYFNRGALLNIGFNIVKDNFDYFCFHDIDLLSEISDYSYINTPTHLSMYCSQFDYRRKIIFGGVTLFTKSQFENINGFSNKFQGWGAEDDNLRDRVVRLYDPEYRPGKYLSLDHIRIGKNNINYDNNVILYNNKHDIPELDKFDGLNSLIKDLQYKIIKIQEIKNDCSFNSIDNNQIIYEDTLNYIIDVDFYQLSHL